MDHSHEAQSPPTIKKKVDDSWKESVAKEKQQVAPEPVAGASPSNQVSQEFISFISNLGMQALAMLGELKQHPDEPAPEPDFEQAKYVIDCLQMLQEKTKGNLSPKEQTMLDSLLYELRMKFVQKTQEGHP